MASSRTAEYVAVYRARETDERSREPLFRDPYAHSFLPQSLVRIVRLARLPVLRTLIERYADRRAAGARSSAICRTRFIDDVVRAEASAGARQLVILGAGYDCRAHRLPELRDTRTFEVDRAETQARKRAVMERASTADVTYVQLDFQLDDLATRLAEAGWDHGTRTTFIWEGVTNYLTQEAVECVLAFVGSSARESALVFTYIHRAVLDGSIAFDGAPLLRQNVQNLGEPWTFGIDPDETAAFAGRFGLALEQDLGADEYRTRYFWGANMRGYAFYRVAVVRHG